MSVLTVRRPKLKASKTFSLDKFISHYSDMAQSELLKMKPSEKLNDETFDVNKLINKKMSYFVFNRYNFNVNQLKLIAKELKLKITGNKPQLKARIFSYLYFSSVIINIQKIIRSKIVRIYEKLHGPAFYKKSLCNNSDDLITCQSLNDIPYNQFVSFKDIDNFIYGFNVASLYQLYLKSNTSNLKNPYNRNSIPQDVIPNLKRLVKVSKLLNIPISLTFDEESDQTPPLSIESRCFAVFQHIGNYSDCNWLLSLNHSELKKFLRELYDIWNYRAQLTHDVKCHICPPNGNPFSNLLTSGYSDNYDILQNTAIQILENMINRSVDNESRTLGGYYILGALTIVSANAAQALPWLYDSMSYN